MCDADNDQVGGTRQLGGRMGAWLGAHRAVEAANEEDFGRALDASRDNNDKHRAGQA